MEYITLTKGDPEFESYLLGTFSDEKRAIPVETFEGHHSGERVTFRIVSVKDLDVPSWWQVYFRSCRPELLPLTMGPAMAAWLNHYAALALWTKWPSWFALIGVFFLHTAAFLYNDFQDHIQGVDRLNRNRGSQVIQRGWVTAAALKKWSWVNAVLALVFGVPAFFNAPVDLFIVCLLSVAALYVIGKNIGRRFGLCDLALWLVFGPLLTCGIALASFARFNMADLFLGCALGALTLWVFHLRQFEYLFRSRPEMFHTFIAYLPFDRARLLVAAEGYLVLLLQIGVGVWLRLPLVVIAFAFLAALPLTTTTLRVWRAESPLASQLVKVSRAALASHFSWTLWWVLGLVAPWL